MQNLPLVRRLEAVGFRAWPASSVQYDGSWQVRLTAGHPSNRLNSIVPLDPSDHRDVEIRLAKASRKFEAYGRPAVLRQTPLASPVSDRSHPGAAVGVIRRDDRHDLRSCPCRAAGYA